MTPQDPQSPVSPSVAPQDPAQSTDGLNAQIPPSYAPGGDTSASPNMAPIGTSSSGSALDDALATQLAVPEPDPMAGFSATPATGVDAGSAAAPAEPTLTGDGMAPPANAPQENIMPASDTAPDSTPTAAVDAPIAPPAVEVYDPAQDAGAGAPATSYPAAPAPLPPNPLEADAAAALVTAPPAPTPMTEDYAAAPISAAPEPAPVEVSAPAPESDATAVDLISGAPIETAPPQPGQMVDPTLQSMLDEPATATDPYSDPATLAAAYPANSSSAGKVKGILIAVGIGIGVLVVGIVVLALILGRKPLSNLSADSLTSSNSSSNSSSSSTNSPSVALPDGYVSISNACASFGLPKQNTVTDTSTCAIDAAFGSQGVSKITVIPSTDTYKSLDEAVTAAKEIYNPTIVKEEKMSLGGLDAYRMDFTTGTDPLTTKLIVLLPNKNYKADGVKMTGMEINISANDAFSQTARDTLISTWSWK